MGLGVTILTLVIIFASIFIFVVIAKNRYEHATEDGEVLNNRSAELLIQIEQAKNLNQINKARVELKASDISPLTKTALYSLLKERRQLLLEEAEDFELDQRGNYQDGIYNENEDEEENDSSPPDETTDETEQE